jgi:uncharacterized membrane protein
VLLVLIKFLQKSMIMHIHLSCLQILGLVPPFNISDLKSYMGEEVKLDSRTTPIQEREEDEYITPMHTKHGPIPRSRAR